MQKAIVLGVLGLALLIAGCKQPDAAPQTLEPEAATPPPSSYGVPAPPAEPEWVSPPPPPPAYVPPPRPVAPPSAAVREHVVKPGENLWKISGMYFDKSSQANVQKIVAANPGLNPDKILIGQVIKIPD